MSEVFELITWLGDWKVVVILAAAVILFLILKKCWGEAFLIFDAVVGGEIIVLVLKNLIKLDRPAGSLEAGFSFPSGHAFMAVVFYGLLAYLIYKKDHNKLILPAVALLAVAIGYSRIALDEHYWIDVVGGWVLGLIWLAIVIYVYKLWINRKRGADLQKTQ